MVWHSVSRRPSVFPFFLLGAFPVFSIDGAETPAPKSAGTIHAAYQPRSAGSAPTETRALTTRPSLPRRGRRAGRAVRIPGVAGSGRVLYPPLGQSGPARTTAGSGSDSRKGDAQFTPAGVGKN